MWSPTGCSTIAVTASLARARRPLSVPPRDREACRRDVHRHRHGLGVVDGQTQQLGRIRGVAQPPHDSGGHTTTAAGGPFVDERVAHHLAEPPFCFCLVLDRHEAHAEGAALEHELGIEIGVAEPHAEVHRRSGAADRCAARELLALDHRDRREERIARAETVRVFDDDVQRAADLARELDGAVSRREDRFAGRSSRSRCLGCPLPISPPVRGSDR